MLENLSLVVYVIGAIALLFTIGHGVASRRHWRARRHGRALNRALWMLVSLCLALLGAVLGTALIGYQRLNGEVPVASLTARQLGPQNFALRVDFPDGTHQSAELRGDEWQLDARVIKWTPRAVMLGAQPLYRLDRISGRYHDAAQAQAAQPTVVPLGRDTPVDLWELKQHFPQWLPWIDADYGSAAYLPLADGANYRATISPMGGLIARPADAATAEKLKAMGW
ncbi:MAG: hypothetical protein P4L92_10135 [Rudaea sp.]|nr:hypothetical protein [Rudaea sp.]